MAVQNHLDHADVQVLDTSVRFVPPISFCASDIGSISATLKDQVTITLSLKNKRYVQYT